MKLSLRFTAITAVTLAVGALGACNSEQSTTKTAQPVVAPTWALQYQADCTAASDPSECVGAYGLTVNSDASYQIGPTPTGRITKGNLSEGDFQALTQAAAELIDGTKPPGTEVCNDFFGPAEDYTLTLTKHGAKSEVLHKKGNTLCSDRLEADAAEAIHNEILSLTEKYYPDPYPNACLDAANELKALYPSVQHCNVAADCGYLDLDFEPIPLNQVEQVYVDNCSIADNLPAANLSAISGELSKLQDALVKTQRICGANILRDHCQGIQSFGSNAAPAVCNQGVCAVNPSLGF